MSTRTEPDLNVLYRILADHAGRGTLSYADLSRVYERKTGERLPARGTWRKPLGRLDAALIQKGYPPLSAIVTQKPTHDAGDAEPAPGFWILPGAPARPSRKSDRVQVWKQALEQVRHTDWPIEMPEPVDAPWLSFDEIRDRYRTGWIVVGNPQTTDDLEIISGFVLAHCLSREELQRRVNDLNPSSAAILYMGERPPNVALNLP